MPPIALAIDEALCADCVAHEGLCHVHARHVLPQLKEPSWPQMIGDTYVCDRPACGEHAACLDVPGHASPRAGCECHACGQRRWMRARERSTRQATESPEAQAHRARKQAARKPKVRRLHRFQRALAGEFTPAPRVA